MTRTDVVEAYVEYEVGVLRPYTGGLFHTCVCGKKVLRNSKPKEEDFGKRTHCPKCKRHLWTISKKITWREYVSGKTHQSSV